MKVETRLFGEIEIADDKLINIAGGIVGFPDLTKFALIFDSEDKPDRQKNIMWLQSFDEPQFAIPVMTPNMVLGNYNPTVNDELLEPLGDLNEENTYVLVTVKVPAKIEDITVNLKAPIVINTDTMIGGQIIVEDDVDIRYPIYGLLLEAKKAAEE